MASDAVLAVLADGGHWPVSWDKPSLITCADDALAYIARCGRRDRHMRQALRALAQAGRRGALRRATRRYLASASARTHSLATAFRRKHGRLADLPENELIGIPLTAGSTSAWRYKGGKPVAVPHAKRDGVSYRYIVHANVFQVAEERLAAAALKAAAVPLPTQFMSPGTGGRRSCEQWLSDNLPSAARVITIDIPRCYATVRHSSVAAVLSLLPGKVRNEVFFKPRAQTKFLKPALIGLLENKASIAQASSSICGIAEGSALSSVAAELVLANVLQEVAEISDAVRVASHGDNLVVLLADAALEGFVRQRLIASICSRFDANPDELAGRISSVSAGQEFRFCRRRYRMVGGKLRTRDAEGYINDYVERTQAAIQDAYDAKDAVDRNERVDRLSRSITGWLQQSKLTPEVIQEAFSLWSTIPEKLITDQES